MGRSLRLQMDTLIQTPLETVVPKSKVTSLMYYKGLQFEVYMLYSEASFVLE